MKLSRCKRREKRACASGIRTGGGIGVTLCKPPEQRANPRKKTQRPKDKHHSGLCVQPSIKKVAENAADHNSGNEQGRQFRRQRKLSGG
jgi:hypothetical protein